MEELNKVFQATSDIVTPAACLALNINSPPVGAANWSIAIWSGVLKFKKVPKLLNGLVPVSPDVSEVMRTSKKPFTPGLSKFGEVPIVSRLNTWTVTCVPWEAAAAPISLKLQLTFPEPSNILPVFPMVNVLAVASLVAVSVFTV